MKSLKSQKQKSYGLSRLVGIVLLAGLTGCSTFAQPLASPNPSNGSQMEKWDVRGFMDRQGPNSIQNVKPRPTQYETFLDNAKEQFHSKKVQLQEYASELNAKWTRVTSTFSGK